MASRPGKEMQYVVAVTVSKASMEMVHFNIIQLPIVNNSTLQRKQSHTFCLVSVTHFPQKATRDLLTQKLGLLFQLLILVKEITQMEILLIAMQRV